MLQLVVEHDQVQTQQHDDDGRQDQFVGLHLPVHGLDDSVLAAETVDVALGLSNEE